MSDDGEVGVLPLGYFFGYLDIELLVLLVWHNLLF
jgi:hypothetical protein